jgi:hypothetical protein
VAEHAVPNVVHQRRGERDIGLMFAVVCRTYSATLFDDAHQLSCDVEYPDAMGKAGVCCSRVDKLREAKLTNAAQALKSRRLNDPPKHLLELIGAKFNEIMNGVPDTLRSGLARHATSRLSAFRYPAMNLATRSSTAYPASVKPQGKSQKEQTEL